MTHSPKTDSRPATLTTLTVRMLPLETALLNTLNALGQHPDRHFADITQEGWQTITLTWPGDNATATRIFKFEINVGAAVGCTVACVLDRVGLSYNWGERFMGLLYSNIDQLPANLYFPPGNMPPLEDAEDPEDIYADMPPLENGGLHTVG